MDDQYDAALDLLRRTSPQNVAQNLTLLCQQSEDLAEDLLSSVDQPLELRTDAKGKQFLCCDYNRDGDSFRSPFTNEFVPPLEDADTLPPRMRRLEEAANDAFDTYRELYYEGGHASCYLWEQDADLAGVVLFQKKLPSSQWDSVHVFEALGSGKSRTYRLTSSVLLEIGKTASLSGSLTRQTERELPFESEVDHVANVGTLVEEMEGKLRSLLNVVYFGKTRDVLGDIRSVEPLSEVDEERRLKQRVVNSLEK